MIKKVISFSVWGVNPIYTIGALKNAQLAKDIYPEWECWFYCGKSIPKEILQQLKKYDNCKIIEVNEQGNWEGMFWRFLPADDSNITMISRDTDSRLNHREKRAVDEWLDSDKDFHIMRDHPYHKTEILGGMWGARNGIIKGIKQWMEDYKKGDFWQVDQNFLKKIIYPKITNNCCVHDEFFEQRPFPMAREGKSFIGEAFNEEDKPLNPEHRDWIA